MAAMPTTMIMGMITRITDTIMRRAIPMRIIMATSATRRGSA